MAEKIVEKIREDVVDIINHSIDYRFKYAVALSLSQVHDSGRTPRRLTPIRSYAGFTLHQQGKRHDLPFRQRPMNFSATS